VFENNKSVVNNKRKREKKNDPSDIDGYLGPWASYVDEQKVAKPNEQEQEELQAFFVKRNKNRKKVEVEDDSRSTLHIDKVLDYAGRSFLHIPQDLGINLRSDEPLDKCYIPKKLLHTYSGHTKGIQRMQLFPVSGHLFLTCSMDSKVKLWEFYKERRCIRTYSGHAQGVRDISFNRDGTQFLSASFDRTIKLWDTETGGMKGKFTNKKVPYCVVFNPDEDKQHLFVAGTSDKKILCFDTRSGDIVQEYDRHLGAVNTITFVDNNRRIVTTSDDKSIRAWEW
jgi:pre-mRNA-processing factor 17